MQKERMNDCQSFGSNQHSSIRSRKISVGIIDDSLVGRKSRARKKQEDAVQIAEELYCDLMKSMENINEKKVADIVEINQQEAQPLVDSPWVSKRSIHRDTSMAETVIGAKRVLNFPAVGSVCPTSKNPKFPTPASCRKPNISDGAKGAPEKVSVTAVTNGTSILKSGESKKVTQDEWGKDVILERPEDFSFTTANNVVMSEKVGTDTEADKAGKQTESLRMRLFEILGTVSSPPDPQSKSQKHDQGVTDLKTEENIVLKAHRTVKSGQNSDTIETDSENPQQSKTRPKTRPTKRKRIPTKLRTNKAKNDTSSIHNVKRQKENVFPSKSGRSRTESVPTNGGRSSFLARNEKKVFQIKRSKSCFTENCDPSHVDQETCRPEAQVSDEKTSPVRNKTSKFTVRNEAPDNETAYNKPGKITDEDLDQSPLANKAESSHNHKSSSNQDKRDEILSPCLRNSIDPDPCVESPTLKINTPGFSSSPILSQKASPAMKSSVLGRKKTTVEDIGISSFRKLQNLKKTRNSNAEDIAVEHIDFLFRRKPANTRVIEEEYDKSESSYEEELESSGEGSTQRSRRISMTEKLKLMLHPTKKLKTDNIAHQKTNWIEDSLEENQEEELARAVQLFALELQKIKSKMKLIALKKSSEILMSASDETDLQLQNVRCQIETDVEKLTNLCKSKRKPLETKVAEQQEQLKLIHGKFKEELNQHLQNSICSLNELEAQRVEIKGVMEKKKISHRNILLQVEESIDGRLIDTQRRIKAIQELAREKMLHLKTIIAASLKEGIHGM